MLEPTNQPQPEPHQYLTRLEALLDAYHVRPESIHPDTIVDASIHFVLSLRDYPQSAPEWQWAKAVFPKPSELPDTLLDQAAVGFAEQYADAINGGIRSVLKDSTDLMDGQPEVAEADCRNRVVMRIRKTLSALCQPGTAAMSTRIFALSRLQALGWQKERLRQRDKCVPTVYVNATSLPNSSQMKKLGKELTQTDIDHQRAETAIKENPAKITRLLCQSCQRVRDVSSQHDDICWMVCGHRRKA